jgi:hypothetical protein
LTGTRSQSPEKLVNYCDKLGYLLKWYMLLQILEKLVLISQPSIWYVKKKEEKLFIYLFSNQMQVVVENNSNPTICFAFAFCCLPLVHVHFVWLVWILKELFILWNLCICRQIRHGTWTPFLVNVSGNYHAVRLHLFSKVIYVRRYVSLIKPDDSFLWAD